MDTMARSGFCQHDEISDVLNTFHLYYNLYLSFATKYNTSFMVLPNKLIGVSLFMLFFTALLLDINVLHQLVLTVQTGVLLEVCQSLQCK